jgi:adenosylmethionine-8-amino-7-oxononanoate aminotransferase
MTNLEIIEEESLLARSRELERELATTLRAAGDHAAVAEVRCEIGFLGAVELEADLLERDPRAPAKLGLEMRERGVMVRALGSSIAVSPPLVSENEHVAMIGDALSTALDTCFASTGSAR